MNNYILDGQDAGEYVDAQLYNMDQMELQGSDTTIYYDDNEVKYVINNYYDGADVDFSYRIHRFHRPYSRFYDPFYWNSWYYDPWYYNSWYYDSWYYPYSSLAWGWGYDPGAGAIRPGTGDITVAGMAVTMAAITAAITAAGVIPIMDTTAGVIPIITTVGEAIMPIPMTTGTATGVISTRWLPGAQCCGHPGGKRQGRREECRSPGW